MLPIINIYRKYYGWGTALRLTGLLYIAMVLAGYAVEALFYLLRLIPPERTAKVLEASVSWNYTTVLNIIFLLVSAWLLVRFFKTGGRKMLKMMSQPAQTQHHH